MFSRVDGLAAPVCLLCGSRPPTAPLFAPAVAAITTARPTFALDRALQPSPPPTAVATTAPGKFEIERSLFVESRLSQSSGYVRRMSYLKRSPQTKCTMEDLVL